MDNDDYEFIGICGTIICAMSAVPVIISGTHAIALYLVSCGFACCALTIKMWRVKNA